jgi:hypothetical protein
MPDGVDGMCGVSTLVNKPANNRAEVLEPLNV